MTAHSATEFVAARAFVLAYNPAWTPEAEALVANVMLRDAIAAGIAPSPPKHERSPAGRFVRHGSGAQSNKARQMIAQGTSPEAVMAATGLSWRTVAELFRAAGQPVRKSMPLSDAGARARELVADGATAQEVVDATGLSLSQAGKLVAARRGPRPPAKSILGRQMAVAGETAEAIVAATGLTRGTAVRLIKEAQNMQRDARAAA